jgi:hypothetical protein
MKGEMEVERDKKKYHWEEYRQKGCFREKCMRSKH